MAKRRVSVNNALAELQGSVETLLGKNTNIPYVHSNEKIRRAGIGHIYPTFTDAYHEIMGTIRNTLQNYINMLAQAEQQWYKEINIQNFDDFKTNVWPLMLQAKVSDNQTIEQGLDKALQIKDANWTIRQTEAKDEKGKYTTAAKSKRDDINKQLDTALSDFAKTYFGDADAFKKTREGKGKKNPFVNSPSQMKLLTEQGNAAFDLRTTLDNVAKNLGWIVEHVWTGAVVDGYAQLINDKLDKKNIQIQATNVGTKAAAKKLGIRAGATDVDFVFNNNIHVGATIKTRYATKGKLGAVPIFGSGVEESFDRAFGASKSQKIASLSPEGISALKYLLVNFWFSTPGSRPFENKTTFLNQIRNILVYNYALFAVLGENWALSGGIQGLPLIYISGKDVYPTRAILMLILNCMSRNKPTNLTSTYWGSWNEPSHMGIKLSKKTKEGETAQRVKGELTGNWPWDLRSFKQVVIKNKKDYPVINYEILYNAIEDLLKKIDQKFFNKKKKIYKVQYEIKNSNIKQISDTL